MEIKRINQKINMEEREQPIGLGVIFIKTRKSEDKIRKMTDEITAIAKETEVAIVDVIVDDSYGSDIDRCELNELCYWIENSPVGMIFVKSLLDITRDDDDLEQFMEKLDRYGVIIVDVDTHTIFTPSICEEESE